MDKGINYCAPVAVAAGLVYLTRARGLDDLVKNTDHDGQIALIRDLARIMGTSNTGTNVDEIVNGVRRYAKRRGYRVRKLEVASWGKLSQDNKKYRVSIKPRLAWMVSTAKDPDIVQVFGFGWYKRGMDGRYTRNNGHWVNVVGPGASAKQFNVHNPALEPMRQRSKTSVTFKLIGQNFLFPGPNGWVWNMVGYYQGEGPGLPFNKQKISAAVLESVIVFKLRKDRDGL